MPPKTIYQGISTIEPRINYAFSLSGNKLIAKLFQVIQSIVGKNPKINSELYNALVRLSLENLASGIGDQEPLFNLQAPDLITEQFEKDCQLLQKRFKLPNQLAKQTLTKIRAIPDFEAEDLVGQEVQISIKQRGIGKNLSLILEISTDDSEFKVNLKKSLYDSLVEAHVILDKDNIIIPLEIAVMVHTYREVFRDSADGYQWAVTPEKMFELQQEYNFDLEMFASPLNRNPNIPEYGSAFGIDTRFGAHQNILSLPDEYFLGKSCEANPPFTEYIITKLIDKVFSVLDKVKGGINPTKFVLILPNWDDLPAIQDLLKKSKYLIKFQSIVGFHSYAKNKLIEFGRTSIYYLESKSSELIEFQELNNWLDQGDNIEFIQEEGPNELWKLTVPNKLVLIYPKVGKIKTVQDLVESDPPAIEVTFDKFTSLLDNTLLEIVEYLDQRSSGGSPIRQTSGLTQIVFKSDDTIYWTLAIIEDDQVYPPK